MCGIVKKTAEWNFFQLGNFGFFKFKKNLLRRIFPVSSFECNKKIFIKKYGVTGLVFKIDAVEGKKLVKFVAMQQDRATLIYDLNTIKGTAESYLKKIAQPFKTEQFLA